MKQSNKSVVLWALGCGFAFSAAEIGLWIMAKADAAEQYILALMFVSLLPTAVYGLYTKLAGVSLFLLVKLLTEFALFVLSAEIRLIPFLLNILSLPMLTEGDNATGILPVFLACLHFGLEFVLLLVTLARKLVQAAQRRRL